MKYPKFALAIINKVFVIFKFEASTFKKIHLYSVFSKKNFAKHPDNKCPNGNNCSNEAFPNTQSNIGIICIVKIDLSVGTHPICQMQDYFSF